MADTIQASAVRMYCRFCNDVSVDINMVSDSIFKMIILFQKNISVDAAYKLMYPSGSFLNWERAPLLVRDRCYADSPSWVGLIGYIEVAMCESEMRTLFKEHAVFHHFDDSLKQAGLKVDAWCFVALYLLVNVGRLQALNAVEQFFSITHNKNIRAEALLLFSLLANRQFDHEAQTKALIVLLQRHCKVKIATMQQELELMELKSQEMEGLFRQKAMRALTGRPKLRSKIRASHSNTGAMFEMDLFASWCANIRFPNVFSLRQRKRLYFVMAQCHANPDGVVFRVLPDKDLSDRVMLYPVKQPEVEYIYDCVSECRISQDPFPELHKFRARCFDSFALEQKTNLRLNDLLHLYISAYQHPTIWKNVWKMSIPILSIQIIRDVESFVEQNPFNGNQVFSLMFGIQVGAFEPQPIPAAIVAPLKPVAVVNNVVAVAEEEQMGSLSEPEEPLDPTLSSPLTPIQHEDDLIDISPIQDVQGPLGLQSAQQHIELYEELEMILT